jgi:hypothetical protein
MLEINTIAESPGRPINEKARVNALAIKAIIPQY